MARNIDIVQQDRNAKVVAPYSSLDMSANPSRSGYFEEGFNNDPAETDPNLAWPGIEFWTGTIGSGSFAVTATWKFPTRFKATHCSLIPKGPNQGKLLLWNTLPVIARCPIVDNNEWWSWQAAVILDTRPGAEVVSSNLLLPIGPVRIDGATEWYPSLFCAGHCWTDNGDLLIAGGNEYERDTFQFGAYQGLWMWNPALSGSIYYRNESGNNYQHTWTEETHGHYATAGAWVRAENMHFKRWYPTPKLTQKFSNQVGSVWNGSRCGVLIFGGQNNMQSDQPSQNPAWNNYEAVAVTASSTATTSGLSFDLRGSPIQKVFPGPGTPGATVPGYLDDWLFFYPSMHLLSTGGMFMSGMAWKSATLTDHASNPGVWDKTIGATLQSGLLNRERVYSMTYLAPNHDGVVDRVVRVGGYHFRGVDATPLLSDTAESCEIINASTAAAQWTTFPDQNLPRTEANLVIAPDADVYLFGGAQKQLDSSVSPPVFGGVFHLKTERMKALASGFASGWELLSWSPAEAFHDYHSTTMLMEDGRIFVGGGDASTQTVTSDAPSHVHNPSASDHPGYDYEMWLPKYLRPNPDPHVVFSRPQNVVLTTATQDADDTYVLSRATTYTIDCDALRQYRSLARVVLMAPGSTTHHNDFCMRYYKPSTQTAVTATQMTFQLPSGDSVLPDGYYMLFVLDDIGVPSEAIWVRI